MKNKALKWPIRATQITNDSTDYSDNNINVLLGQGIIANNHLRGLVQNFMDKTNTVARIYEIDAVSSKLAVTSGFYSNPILADFCRLYEYVASDVPQVKKQQIRDFFHTALANSSTNAPFEVFVDNFQHTIYFFPVVVDDRAIGMIEISNFFTKEKFLVNPNSSPVEIVEIIEKFKSHIPESLDFDLIAKSIEKLQLILYSKLEELRVNYINSANNILIENLRSKLEPFRDFEILDYWKIVTTVLRSMIELFPAKFCRIFASTNIIHEKVEEFNMVAATDLSYIACQNYTYFFDISKYDRNRIITSIESESLLLNVNQKGKSVELDSSEDFIRIFPSIYSPNGLLIIWVRYDKEKWDRIDEISVQIESERVFQNLIVSFYTFLSSTFSSVVSYSSLQAFNKYYKIHEHEIDNIATAIDANRARYIGTLHQRNLLNPERFELLNSGIENLVQLIKSNTKISKDILVGKLVPQKTSFRVLGDVLAKWSGHYILKCISKSNQIILPENFANQYKHPKLFADRFMIEAVIYNLVENANKYSYRGTKVRLNYERDYNLNRNVITIVNYCQQVDTGRAIYELFARGKEASSQVDGLGVGLYVCRKIIEAHEGEIDHFVEPLSDYNIPILAFAFISENNANHFGLEQETLLAEYNRVKRLGVLEEVVATDNVGVPFFKPAINRQVLELNKPTFRITFKVLLP